jgi:hypothetical protein
LVPFKILVDHPVPVNYGVINVLQQAISLPTFFTPSFLSQRLDVFNPHFTGDFLEVGQRTWNLRQHVPEEL